MHRPRKHDLRCGWRRLECGPPTAYDTLPSSPEGGSRPRERLRATRSAACTLALAVPRRRADRGKPNCSPLGDCALEGASGLPRDNRSVAAEINANLAVRLRALPLENAITVTREALRTDPASLNRLKKPAVQRSHISRHLISAHRHRFLLRNSHDAFLQSVNARCLFRRSSALLGLLDAV
jgi:hypothetical protein